MADKIGVLYAWVGGGNTYYVKTRYPQINDTVYNNDGTIRINCTVASAFSPSWGSHLTISDNGSTKSVTRTDTSDLIWDNTTNSYISYTSFYIFIGPGNSSLSFTGSIISNENSPTSISFNSATLPIVAGENFGDFYLLKSSSFYQGVDWYITINSNKRSISNVKIYQSYTSSYYNANYIYLDNLYSYQCSDEASTMFSYYASGTRIYNEAWDCKNIYTDTLLPANFQSLIYDSNGLAFRDIQGDAGSSSGDWGQELGYIEASAEKITLKIWE